MVSIFLGTGGHLDSVPVEDVSRFESELLDHLRGSDNGILSDIRESQKLSEETEKKLTDAIKDFKKGFAATGGGSVVPDEHVEALTKTRSRKNRCRCTSPHPRSRRRSNRRWLPHFASCGAGSAPPGRSKRSPRHRR